jgi:alkanesulfonate monooxygenase SsuD/methylene tetrahydromethanopterin reductase-like flavin-dependent oxidoreductase (luciferase family)
MNLGIFNLMTLRDPAKSRREILDETLSLVQLAEAIGIDIAWFAEHHFSNYSISPSPLMMASWMAAKTTTIKVGPAVIVLPLYHPMRVAQEVALLDIQSGGRAVVGIGSGYQAYEFERYGARLDNKADVMLEYWQVLEQALDRGYIDFKGEHFTAPPTELALRPLQKSLSPFYVTGSSPAILRRVVETGGVMFMTAGWRGSQGLFAMYEQMKEQCRKLGLGEQLPATGIQQYIHVTDDRQQALVAADCARYVGRLVTALRKPKTEVDGFAIREETFEGEPSLETFRDNLIIGDAHHVAQRMAAEIKMLRPAHYNCFFQFGALPVEMARSSMVKFGRDVLPLLEREVGPLDQIGRQALSQVA